MSEEYQKGFIAGKQSTIRAIKVFLDLVSDNGQETKNGLYAPLTAKDDGTPNKPLDNFQHKYKTEPTFHDNIGKLLNKDYAKEDRKVIE